jgi:hypothetical protein
MSVHPGRAYARGQMKLHALLVLAALLGPAALAACGESDEEKAQNAVCDARADIEERLDDLAELTITSASIDQVTNNLEAIRDDLQKIADQQGDLEPERREEVEQAGKKFRSELGKTAEDLISGATSGEEAGARARSSLQDLANSLQTAYEPVNCD